MVITASADIINSKKGKTLNIVLDGTTELLIHVEKVSVLNLLCHDKSTAIHRAVYLYMFSRIRFQADIGS